MGQACVTTRDLNKIIIVIVIVIGPAETKDLNSLVFLSLFLWRGNS